MQIWPLFIILTQPVHISVTVFSHLTKLTLVGPTVTRLVLDSLAVFHLDNRLYFLNELKFYFFQNFAYCATFCKKTVKYFEGYISA